jgi:hypothetical protein
VPQTDINHVLIALVHGVAMALTSEQHAPLASANDKAAADCLIPPEQQTAFARKANWYRVLARLSEKNERRQAKSRSQKKAASVLHSSVSLPLQASLPQ